MTQLTQPAESILRELIAHIDSGGVDASNPQTFLGYGQVHEALGLQVRGGTIGNSLKVQGLADLAEWTKIERLPAITGLIVDKSPESNKYLSPGDGYFRLFGKRYPDDHAWWIGEVTRSMGFDWESLLEPELRPKADSVPKTDEATDLASPPDRVETTTYRILRDTEIARRVKLLHDYRCQICGHRIALPNGNFYAEAHHIHPLGQQHKGPDVIGNILCLCPNHHAELDYGVCEIVLSELKRANGHVVEQKYVDYHNNKIWIQIDG